jgi:hypothetical protein
MTHGIEYHGMRRQTRRKSYDPINLNREISGVNESQSRRKNAGGRRCSGGWMVGEKGPLIHGDCYIMKLNV